MCSYTVPVAANLGQSSFQCFSKSATPALLPLLGAKKGTTFTFCEALTSINNHYTNIFTVKCNDHSTCLPKIQNTCCCWEQTPLWDRAQGLRGLKRNKRVLRMEFSQCFLSRGRILRIAAQIIHYFEV